MQEPRPPEARGSGGESADDAASKAAAHRMPTGAYLPVTENASATRPRSETDPEPGALFRPAGSRSEPDPTRRTGAEPQAAPVTRASAEQARPTGGSQDVQATVKVNAVRAAQSSDATPYTDATVVSPPPAR